MSVKGAAARGRMLGIVASALSASCATRSVPDQYPATSAASLDASAPKAADVTRSLSAEPDEASAPPEASPASHEGHHHAH